MFINGLIIGLIVGVIFGAMTGMFLLALLQANREDEDNE